MGDHDVAVPREIGDLHEVEGSGWLSHEEPMMDEHADPSPIRGVPGRIDTNSEAHDGTRGCQPCREMKCVHGVATIPIIAVVESNVMTKNHSDASRTVRGSATIM